MSCWLDSAGQIVYNFLIKRGDKSKNMEKEYIGILFDQLTILERLERALVAGGNDGLKKEIDIIRKEIMRKLYCDVQS